MGGHVVLNENTTGDANHVISGLGGGGGNVGVGGPSSVAPFRLALKISRAMLWLTYGGGVILGSWIVYALTREKASETQDYAFAIAGIFVGLAVPLSLYDMNMHMAHYVSPLQAYVLRVLWIVPIYSVQSWIALVYKEDAFFFVTMREVYEAYAIFSFYQLMLGALGGKGRLSKRLLAVGKERAACLPPCCCLRGWKMGSRFVHRCTVGVYQYVLIRVVVSVGALIAEGRHMYHEGTTDFRYFYPWASLMMNFSQLTALYCLAAFYMETHAWGQEMRPLKKFLVIKAIVFVSWWQSIAIVGLGSLGYVPSTLNYSTAEVSMAIQNFAICVEMFFYQIGFHYFFPYTDFYSETPGVVAAFSILAANDAEADAKEESLKGGGGGTFAPYASRAATPATPAASLSLSLSPPSTSVPQSPRFASENPLPLGYGAAVKGLLPFDVISDTADSLRTGVSVARVRQARTGSQATQTPTFALTPPPPLPSSV